MNTQPRHVDATQTVDFVVLNGERRCAASISYKALCDHFEGFFRVEESIVAAYLRNAAIINSTALCKLRQGASEPVLLRTSDF